MKLTAISDFVVWPSERFGEKSVEVVRHEVNRVVLRSGIDEWVVDEQTGFVCEYRHGGPKLPRFRETIQYGPKKYLDGIILPGAIFQGDYSGEELNNFSVKVLVDVEINGVVPGEAFIIGGWKGDTVVDRRGAGKAVSSLEKDTFDVTLGE